eukprot:CAMPEP_0202338544 /NCGR_PEP_ID=MMETSP1126-20121109/779_1 /ASSEMBLY_ACC=CAM_ASM_000457 /TAXON_ID=3047 /ORGANISM="Dunaliella tertiolecta, Strain CCMP1320" /LENGTH=129 /DNA_ID=CAMNT_0048928947 /DNA_START=312 /DNA_END=698 /DNA_ORIENTATION=+
MAKAYRGPKTLGMPVVDAEERAAIVEDVQTTGGGMCGLACIADTCLGDSRAMKIKGPSMSLSAPTALPAAASVSCVLHVRSSIRGPSRPSSRWRFSAVLPIAFAIVGRHRHTVSRSFGAPSKLFMAAAA